MKVILLGILPHDLKKSPQLRKILKVILHLTESWKDEWKLYVLQRDPHLVRLDKTLKESHWKWKSGYSKSGYGNLDICLLTSGNPKYTSEMIMMLTNSKNKDKLKL